MSARELERLTKELDRMRRENKALRAMAAEKFGEIDIVVSPESASLLRAWAKASQHVEMLVEMGLEKLHDHRLRNDSLGAERVHELALAANKTPDPMESVSRALMEEHARSRQNTRRGVWPPTREELTASASRPTWLNSDSANANPKDDAATALRMLGYADLSVRK